MKRSRFKTARICSSENYTISIKIHRQDLCNNHIELSKTVSVHKVAYTYVFGKKVYLTKEEVSHVSSAIKVYYE